LIEKMAPQVGLEPTTLRLTGGKNVVSHALPNLAGICRTLRQSANNLRDFWVSPCAGRCRALPLAAAVKGQEKGNVPNRTCAMCRHGDAMRTTPSTVHACSVACDRAPPIWDSALSSFQP